MNKQFEYDFEQQLQRMSLIDHIGLHNKLELLAGSTEPTSIALDALDLARATNFADRYSIRSPRNSTEPRDIKMRLPVREANRWTPGVIARYTRALNFGTQDNWAVEVVPKASRPPLQQSAIFKQAQLTPLSSARVSLFSGGLDSVAGALLRGYDEPVDMHVLVAATGPTLNKMQDDIYEQMNSLFRQQGVKTRFEGTTFATQIRKQAKYKELFLCDPDEYSQRSRGALFLTLGAVTAMSLNLTSFEVYENGVGAINLPFTNAAIGADGSRAMHPLFLAYMQEFFSLLFDQPITIQAPFLDDTKGQMCQRLAELRLDAVVEKTVSCEYHGTAAQGKKLRLDDREVGEPVSVPHCGICTSCLLRRASTTYAGMADGPYKHGLPIGLLGKAIENARWFTLMDLQVKRLGKALGTVPTRPLQGVMLAYPDLLLAVEGLQDLFPNASRLELEARLAALYEQYAVEWTAMTRLPAGTR